MDLSTSIPATGASIIATPSSATGAGMGIGGLVGGGIVGLILGSMLNGNNGLFGNRNTPSTEAVALGALEFMEQSSATQLAIANAGASGVAAARENGIQTAQQTGQIQTALAAGNITTLGSINDLGRDITAGQNQIQLQTLNSFNNLTTTLLQATNTLAATTVNSTNQIQSTLADQNMQQAQCCCEIKSAIAADGGMTRALISDIRLADLTAQLTDAKLALSNSAQTETIIAALSRDPRLVRTA